MMFAAAAADLGGVDVPGGARLSLGGEGDACVVVVVVATAGFGLARRAVVLRALFLTGVPESESSLDEGLNEESKERRLVRLILHFSCCEQQMKM